MGKKYYDLPDKDWRKGDRMIAKIIISQLSRIYTVELLNKNDNQNRVGSE